MSEKIVTTIALLLGVLLVANGVYQILAPESWYWAIPGVPDRGPFNQHFVRDIGIIYALCGAGIVLGGLNPGQRFAFWWAPTFWLGGHAIFHAWEVMVGICGFESLLEDFAGVSLPALLTIGLLWYCWGRARSV